MLGLVEAVVFAPDEQFGSEQFGSGDERGAL
jgi:hypothetical protein